MQRSQATLSLIAKLEPVMGSHLFERIEEELCLPAAEPSYRLNSPIMLIMLFAARAGSSYAGTLIGNLPGFGIVTESLNPRALERARLRYELTHDADALQLFLDRRGREMFGFRCTQIGLASAISTGLLAQYLDRARFIVLRRRDVVAQAVSMVVAQRSGQFHSFQPRTGDVSVDDYDYAVIDDRRRTIESIYARHDAVLTALGATAPTFYYEDVAPDPRGFVGGVCDYLNLAMPEAPEIETRVEKLPNTINAEWIRRYREEAAARAR
ncbi:MAG: sulfotransferase [Sphingomonadaceae bacterium]|nr:sulfotransferase [Sphingomonadaceae bacterium]